MGFVPSFGSVVRIVGGFLAVSLISTAGLLYRYQTSLIYPSSFPAGSKAEVNTPDEYDLPYTEEQLITPDSQKLRVFVMLQGTKLAPRRPTPKIQAVEDEKPPQIERKSTPTQTGITPVDTFDAELARKRPTVLFLHANAGNMGHRLPIAAVFFKRFGCNVVMLSYRGYGFSTGSPNERGIKIDTQTTLDFIRSHPCLSSTVLVAYGQSIGGAVAIDLAARNPASVHALILENTFLSIPELIPHVLPPVRPFAFLCREYWNSGTTIAKIPPKVPTLFLSGRQDELVPPAHMDALFQRCNSKVKVKKEFADGTHNDTCIKPKYFESVGEFLLAHVVTLVHDRAAAAVAEEKEEEEDDDKEKKSGKSSSTRREASGDESDDWVQMSHSEIKDEAKVGEIKEKQDADAPTLSKVPKL
ncbi:related to Protein bem46 [Ustilago trichophora]|uniref:Related to Protein bem46 n=1 Tax=Ustilago trichophora TaxID=86804 RepID=A0A5C3ES45_9BASI|nr:related to Protein bem46 [Ustilago trichophora]